MTTKQVLFVENSTEDNIRGTFERYHAENYILRTDQGIRIIVEDDDNEPTRLEVDGHLLADKLRSRSDMRLKSNVKTLPYSLKTVLNLCPKEYYYKNETNKSYGLIAQEVQQIIPNIVSNDSENFLNINYIELIPFLINSIKELNAKLERLENKLKTD